MKKRIVYVPYKTQKCFVWICKMFEMLSFVLVGVCLYDFSIFFLFPAISGFAFIFFSKIIYSSSNTMLFFEDDGILIFDGIYQKCEYLQWDEFQYSFYYRNFKGNMYIVLTSKKLNRNDLKKIVNKGSNLSKVFVNADVVFCLDELQDIAKIKEIIESKTINHKF